MDYLEYMGFTINLKKSAPWPSRQATYLGLRLDTVSMRATLTQERWLATRTVLAKIIPGSHVRYHTIKRLLGLLASAHQVVPLGLLFMRRLQLWFAVHYLKYGDNPRFNNYNIRVPQEVGLDLDHWNRACTDMGGVPMGPRGPEVTIFTDASLKGWGAILDYKTARGVWPSGENLHINVRETETIWLAIQHFSQYLVGRHILIMTDSMTAKAYINRQGGMKSERCRELTRHIWLWVNSNALSIRALHVPGKDNEAADILSRGGPHADNWSLNPLIVAMIWERFGVAQVDLFASKANYKCPLWYSMSPSDEAPLGVNALGPDPWPGKLLYAFPPYSRLFDLMCRFERSGGRLILVAPYETSNTWFPLLVPWIQGERLDLPEWEDALTQARGLLREGPWIRGARLAAWMLSKPDTGLGA